MTAPEIPDPVRPLATGNTHADYLQAAAVLWGEAGRYAVTEYQRLNSALFDGALPPLPVVIGLTAYGKCLGATRDHGEWDAGHLPRISLAPEIFRGSRRMTGGRNVVTDVVLHEMLHAHLMLAGRDHKHNGRPWCQAISRLSPLLLGCDIKAVPVNPRRVDGTVVRRPREGHLDRKTLAGWPGTLRGPDWDRGEPIPVDTY